LSELFERELGLTLGRWVGGLLARHTTAGYDVCVDDSQKRRLGSRGYMHAQAGRQGRALLALVESSVSGAFPTRRLCSRKSGRRTKCETKIRIKKQFFHLIIEWTLTSLVCSSLFIACLRRTQPNQGDKGCWEPGYMVRHAPLVSMRYGKL
jgi:hypothetical protein